MRIAALVGVSILSLAGTPDSTPGQVAARAFEPYEAVRATLASDKLDGIAAQAVVLAPLAGELAGADARTATERLGNAADLKAAGEAFGALSTLLVPKVREAD